MGRTWDFNIQLSTIILSPGEIKRREVSWTLTKQLDAFAESRRDQEEGGELDSNKAVRCFCRVQARSRGGR